MSSNGPIEAAGTVGNYLLNTKVFVYNEKDVQQVTSTLNLAPWAFNIIKDIPKNISANRYIFTGSDLKVALYFARKIVAKTEELDIVEGPGCKVDIGLAVRGGIVSLSLMQFNEAQLNLEKANATKQDVNVGD